MSDFNLKRPSLVEDAKALCILDQVAHHDGVVKSSRLRQEIVKKQGAMSRSTFWDKLILLEQTGFLRREARMEENKAVTYIVLAEPYLGILQQVTSVPDDLHVRTVMERLEATDVSAEEKEEILAGLLKEYMTGSVDWILKVVKECLQAEDLDGATLAPIFSARYIFGARLTTITLLYWKFKAYGAGALRMVEEGLLEGVEVFSGV